MTSRNDQNDAMGLTRRNVLQLTAVAAATVTVGSLTAPGLRANPYDSVVGQLVGEQGLSPFPNRSHLVRPIIGTGWHGHTFPGAMVPFGLVQLSPMADDLPLPTPIAYWAYSPCGNIVPRPPQYRHG